MILFNLEFFIPIGIGAFSGIGFSIMFATLSLFFPVLWPWIFLPVGVGTMVGVIWALMIEIGEQSE